MHRKNKKEQRKRLRNVLSTWKRKNVSYKVLKKTKEAKSENNATSYPFFIESELVNKYKLVEEF